MTTKFGWCLDGKHQTHDRQDQNIGCPGYAGRAICTCDCHKKDETFEDLLTKAHELATEVYLPAGVLIYWSSSNKMLDGRRPCDVTHERDIDGMRAIVRVLDVLASGSFA